MEPEPDHPALVIWCDLGPMSTPRDLAAIQSAITDLTENVLLIELLDRELISPDQLIKRRTGRFYLNRSPTFRSPLPVPRVLAAGYVNPWWQVIDVDLADVVWLGLASLPGIALATLKACKGTLDVLSGIRNAPQQHHNSRLELGNEQLRLELEQMKLQDEFWQCYPSSVAKAAKLSSVVNRYERPSIQTIEPNEAGGATDSPSSSTLVHEAIPAMKQRVEGSYVNHPTRVPSLADDAVEDKRDAAAALLAHLVLGALDALSTFPAVSSSIEEVNDRSTQITIDTQRAIAQNTNPTIDARERLSALERRLAELIQEQRPDAKASLETPDDRRLPSNDDPPEIAR